MLILFVIRGFTMKIVGPKFFILSKLIHYYVGPTAYGIFSMTIKVEIIIFNSVSIQTVLYFTQIRLVLYYLFKALHLKTNTVCGLD